MPNLYAGGVPDHTVIGITLKRFQAIALNFRIAGRAGPRFIEPNLSRA
jgi:hypothetical protein